MFSPLRVREQDLVGKVAIITGASRGIGRAIAVHLASRGCSILGTCSSEKNIHLINSISEETGTTSNQEERSKNSVTAVGIVADIFSPACAQIIANALIQHFHSRVDIFVNSAAEANAGTLGALTVEEISKSLLANVQTPVLIVEECVKRKLFQKESRIIYISSIRTRQPWSGQLMYSAGKSAGESLCRTWAQAFGGKEEEVLSHSTSCAVVRS
jgi:3-oxoacyl-[acyl-carrier protein] reductase